MKNPHDMNNAMQKIRLTSILVLLLGLTACQDMPPMATVAHVDLKRFLGNWYIIGSIGIFVEKGAHNAVESYALNPDGTIATIFTFHAGSFDGDLKRYTPTGFVLDKNTSATWGMQFIWPIKADYRIIYLADDYSLTVIGRKKRDYVWIMARTPKISDANYQRALQFIGAQGYDIHQVQKVPQKWQ
jgi:apolipoprotein D and lipocalin family protein